MEKHKEGLRVGFETILSRYSRAATQSFGKSNPLWATFETVADALRSAPEVHRFKNVVFRWSVGQGRWAIVPWIAALDSRETTKTSEGVYVIYLFRGDMTGVYITLDQGTISMGEGRGRNALLRERAAKLRGRSKALETAGFDVRAGIDLRSKARAIRSYEESTAAFKLYERGSVPSDNVILADLAAALSVYSKLVPTNRFLEASH